MSGFCQNRVVIVTGAGSGLGRGYALALAAEGARVIVNDINEQTAAQTVDEIRRAGGEARVDTRDITSYEAAGRIVRDALEIFGDLHAVVNNAGICRDRMFVSLTEEDWDRVMAVHLKGHFCISSHAAKYWRARAKAGGAVSGRIINTSSGAGLQGSVGQANYSAAKGGILSLTLVQAAELARYGITANAIAPQARTGMTEEVFADMMKKPEDGGFDVFDPANVAPLVVWLASACSAEVTGRCFEICGGEISVADGWRSGEALSKGARWTVAELDQALPRLIARTPPAQKVYGS
ncbi:SDR family oxidoreductase [Luteithermobacter gelatinilyticus]|uniref:SDR family oxidoreductase n=1 Tax=Luteithermobacter gelatinilyticus TaxID=2582913 RepID=UPI0011068EC9|nr:SDR family oxidoreductase [Luteithermobacter gelatinilyticus]